MINQSKFPKFVLIILIFVIIAISIIGGTCPKTLPLLNLIILTLTLFILCIYTFDTNRLANKAEEDAIKPIILRSGFLDWNVNSTDFIKKNPGSRMNLEFSLVKNVALNITGFIVIENKKYELLFANEVTTQQSVLQNKEVTIKSVAIIPKWSWLSDNGKLNATFDSNKFEEYVSGNLIEIIYFDINGNKYFTKEDQEFSQTSGKLQIPNCSKT